MNDGQAAVVLSGGGAHGAYEVGVMKALFAGQSPATSYQPLTARVFSGTSLGAFNAAMMTMEPDASLTVSLARLEQVWINEISAPTPQSPNGVYRLRGNPLRYFNPMMFLEKPGSQASEFVNDVGHFARYWLDHATTFTPSFLGPVRRLFGAIDFSAMVCADPFHDLIGRCVDFAAIRNSSRVLHVATTNLREGKLKVFTNKDMTDELGCSILLASAAIPGMFPMVEVSGEVYVDGAVLMNTPLNYAIDAGASTLHVIYLDSALQAIPLRRLQNTLDTFDRVYTVMKASKFDEDIWIATRVNEGIAAAQRIAKLGTVSDEDAKLFIRVAGQVVGHINKKRPPKRALTIHRYHPCEELGGGLGYLDFERSVVARMIELGFQDAVRHDCESSNCILPE
jgi:predicted acylesterase/phospholipase RssA